MIGSPKLREMNLEEFKQYSRFAFDSFIEDAARASGETVDSVRKRVGDPPDQPSSRDLWYVVEHDQRYIGYIWIKLLPETNEAFGFDIYLEESYRGRGFGRQVMLEGGKLLRKFGVQKLKICVFSENTPALKLYESLGFREIRFIEKNRQHEMEIAF